MNFDYTIIIPLYNHEKYIEEALTSCLEQTLPAQKIIIIDDGSKDNSFDVVKKKAKNYAQVEVFSRANQGAHATINEALAKVTTPYVAILNSDDAYLKNRFEILMKQMQSSPQTDLVFSKIAFLDQDSHEIPHVLWYENSLLYYAKNKSMELSLIHANFAMTTSNFLFKTSLLKELGGFANYRYAHDLEFLLRLLAKKKKVDFIDQKLMLYRLHPQNTIRESQEKIFKELASIQKDFFKLAKPNWLFKLKTSAIAYRTGYLSIFLKTMLGLRG